MIEHYCLLPFLLSPFVQLGSGVCILTVHRDYRTGTFSYSEGLCFSKASKFGHFFFYQVNNFQFFGLKAVLVGRRLAVVVKLL